MQPVNFGRSRVTVLSVLFLTICALSISFWIILTDDVATSPSIKNESTGNVVTYTNHGKTVFITKKQDFLLKYVPVFGFGLFGVGFLIQRFRSQRSKSEFPR